MPQLVDFAPLGDLYNTYRQSQAQRARQDALPQYGGDLDLARLAQQQEQQQFMRGITERQTSLAERTAAEAARGFDYREIDDGTGNKVLVKIDKASGAVTRPDIAGVQTAPNNPFQTGKMNEAQSKDALYTSRMLNAERVLQDPATIDAATSLTQRGLGSIPIAGNYAVSTAYQKFDQAQRDYINAVLRRESGAVISKDEFDNARKQYFPQPGDTPERIEQKRQNRLEAIRGIGAGAGPGYKPSMTIGEGGKIVENPATKQKQPAQPAGDSAPNTQAIAAFRANPRGVIEEARAAVAKGADPVAVAKRIGVSPAYLTGQ